MLYVTSYSNISSGNSGMYEDWQFGYWEIMAWNKFNLIIFMKKCSKLGFKYALGWKRFYASFWVITLEIWFELARHVYVAGQSEIIENGRCFFECSFSEAIASKELLYGFSISFNISVHEASMYFQILFLWVSLQDEKIKSI